MGGGCLSDPARELEHKGSPANFASVLELAFIDLIGQRALDKDAAIAAIEAAAGMLQVEIGSDTWRELSCAVNSLYAARIG